MPVEYQDFITRADLQKNPEKIFLFADDLSRSDGNPQALVMRGEPNAIGIVVKRNSANGNASFFSEYDLLAFKNQLRKDLHEVIAALACGVTVVIPKSGLETMRLEERTPRLFIHLNKSLQDLSKVKIKRRRARNV